MKKLPFTSGTLARWLAVAALLIAPTFLRYEVTSQPTFACTRDGTFAGTCHAEATLRQAVHLDKDWEPSADAAPRMWFMPAMRIDDIGMATPSGGEHALRLRGSTTCYARQWPMAAGFCAFGNASLFVPLDDSYSPSDERTLAVEMNTFLRKETVRSFRVHQPGTFRPEYALLYIAAAFVAFFTLKRSLALRTADWVKRVEGIPATPITAYRG